MARKRDDTVKLVLRLPPALHRQLTRIATRKNQSLNSEMVWRLEGSLRWAELDPAVEALVDAAYAAIEALYEAGHFNFAAQKGEDAKRIKTANKLRMAASKARRLTKEQK